MKHSYRRNRRRGTAYLLAAMILLPLLGAPLQMALATDTTSSGTLKRNDTTLQSGDIVLQSDTLAWEQAVNFGQADDAISVDLPQGLTAITGEKATLISTDDETKTYQIEMDVTGQTIKIKKPSDPAPTVYSVPTVNNTLPPEITQPEPETPAPEPSEPEVPEVSEPEQSEPQQPELVPQPEEPEETAPQTSPQIDPEIQEEPTAPSEPEPAPDPEQSETPEEPAAGIDPEALFSAAFFSLVPHAAAAEDSYTLSVPCKIDPDEVKDDDGTITIGDPKLLTLTVPAATAEAPIMDLYTKYVNEITNTPLAGEISLNTPLYLRLFWENLLWINTETDYSIRLPSPLSSAAKAQQGKITLSGVLNSEGRPITPTIAEWNIAAGSDILHITFKDETFYFENGQGKLETCTTKDADQVYFIFQSTLDEDQLSKGQDANTTFTLPGGKTYHVTINDWQPKAPKLEKTAGAFDADGVVTWTVNYTTASSTYDKAGVPAKLVDKLPEGVEYVTNTFNGTDSLTIDASVEGVLTFTPFADKIKPNTEYTFSYKTRLTDQFMQDKWVEPPQERTFENKIKGQTDVGTDISGLSASSTATLAETWSGWNLVAKTGELEWDGEQPYLDWTVTVNTVSRQFMALTVKDTLGKGLTLIGDISINNATGAYTIAADTDKTIITIPLIERDGTVQTAKSQYVITYRTNVDPKYFSQTGDVLADKDVSNYATLEWEWPDGKGPRPDYDIPTVEKNPGNINNFSKNMIQKSAGTYTAAERALNWTVTVNPNKVDLKEITLEEELKQTPDHTFDRAEAGSSTAISLVEAVDIIKKTIEDSLPKNGAAVSVTPDANVSSMCTKLTIKITGLSKNVCRFNFKSYVSDSSIWANNTPYSQIFDNEVTITSATTNTDQTVDVTGMNAAASESVDLEVLKKEVAEYDPKNQEIVWRITVNHGEAPLSDIEITETLPDGLTYVEGSAKISAPEQEEKDMTPLTGVASSAGKVAFSVPEQTPPAAQWLLFRTKVDVDAEEYEKQETVIYQNHISMTNAEGTTPIADCDFELINNPLKKTNVYEGNVINYTVSLNPLGAELLTTMDGAKLYMKDQLGDCLFLDVDSVKITEASQTVALVNGKYLVSLEPLGGGALVKDVAYNTAENSFQIEIPDASKPYVITYTAYATRGGELTNTVSLVGSKLPTDGDLKSNKNNFTLDATSGARLRLPAGKFLSFSVKKTDENDNLLKSGTTEFGVYTDAATQNLITIGKVNDKSGYCELGLPASAVEGIDTLYLKELTAPKDYVISPAAIKISVAAIQAETSPEGYVETVKNVKRGGETGGSFTLTKTDNDGDTLQGVTFGLYQDADAKTPVLKDGEAVTGVTGADGKITFSGLYPGATYYVKELGTLETHVLDSTPYQAKAGGEIQITNDRAEAEIRVIKLREGKGHETETLAGAKFALFTDEKGEKQKGDVQTTDADGAATFSGLQPRTEYWLKETEAPAGYEGNDALLGQLIKIKTGENDANNPKVITVTNKKILVSIKAVKVRQGKEEIKLSGAGFELYRGDENDKKLVRTELRTDKNGEILYENLEPDTYWLKETITPTGYKTPQNVWTEVKTKDFTDLVPKELKITNEKILVSLHVIKKGDGAAGPRLPGAKLALYEADKTTLVHAAQTTDANGETTFTNLEPETTYYIRETESPKGYRIKNEWTEVKTGAFDAAKPADATVVNEKILVGIRVIKVREGDPETKLEGAKFELYSDAEGKSLLRAAQATDANGVTEFLNLQPETVYYLKETEAPSGYRILTDGLIAIKTGEGAEGAQPVEWVVENARRRSSSSSRPKPPAEEPETPVVPVGPTDPVNPADPTGPDQPAKPDDPTNPDNPQDAGDPSKPGGSDDPANPDKPGDPSKGDGTVTVPSESTPGGAFGTASSGNRVSSIPETGVRDRIPLWALGLACSLGLAAVLCLSQLIFRPKGKHMKKRG